MNAVSCQTEQEYILCSQSAGKRSPEVAMGMYFEPARFKHLTCKCFHESNPIA
jgi:hypothetical protein